MKSNRTLTISVSKKELKDLMYAVGQAKHSADKRVAELEALYAHTAFLGKAMPEHKNLAAINSTRYAEACLSRDMMVMLDRLLIVQEAHQ